MPSDHRSRNANEYLFGRRLPARDLPFDRDRAFPPGFSDVHLRAVGRAIMPQNDGPPEDVRE